MYQKSKISGHNKFGKNLCAQSIALLHTKTGGFRMNDVHGYNKRLCVSDKVYEKVMTQAVREHIRHNPDKAGRKITQNEIVNIIVEFYLRAKVW